VTSVEPDSGAFPFDPDGTFIAPIPDVRTVRNLDGAPRLLPFPDRDDFYRNHDQKPEAPDPAYVAQADRYFSTFRITATPSGLQITGADQKLYRAPSGTAQFRQITKSFSSGWGEYLALCDPAGLPLMLLPGYGWDIKDQVAPFAARIGMGVGERVRLSRNDNSAVGKAFYKAVTLYVGDGSPAPRVLSRGARVGLGLIITFVVVVLLALLANPILTAAHLKTDYTGSAQGTVTHIGIGRLRPETSRYTVDGHTYTTTTTNGDPGLKVGDSVTVHYDPSHPAEGTTGTVGYSLLGLGAAGGTLAVIFGIVFYVSWSARHRKRAAEIRPRPSGGS